MKSMKKLLAFALVLVMLSALSVSVFAETISPAESQGSATITITNAAIGVDYAVYKLFDATVTTTQTDGESDGISYTGTVPDSLTDYFEKNAMGYITAKDAAIASDGSLTEAAIGALDAWAKTQTPVAKTAEGGCTDSPLVFSNLAYGYYIVTTSQGDAAITVDSTKPNATIIDKNTTPPINEPTKTAKESNLYIGDKAEYTISFGTANYYVASEGAAPETIIQYIISDDFVNGALDLDSINVTKITIGGTEYKVDGTVPQFDANKQIKIDWVDSTGKPIYKNGAEIVISYEGIVTKAITIAGTGNVNKATITFKTDKGTTPTPVEVNAKIYSYALAIKKVDPDGKALAGATFKFPFYVEKTADTDGAYVYAGTEVATNLVNELTTPDNGIIIVKGLKSGVAVSIEETAAPEGYNKLKGSVSVTPVQTEEITTSKTYWIDEDGNVYDEEPEVTTKEVKVEISALAATPVLVVNKLGTEMPSTGGIGTTMFYVFGTLLVLGAGVVLVTKRRVRE